MDRPKYPAGIGWKMSQDNSRECGESTLMTSNESWRNPITMMYHLDFLTIKGQDMEFDDSTLYP